MASALDFELSKVTLLHVRERVMARLRNIDVDLAKRVADGLAMSPWCECWREAVTDARRPIKSTARPEPLDFARDKLPT